MFLQRSAFAVARRAVIRPAVARTFTSSIVRRDASTPQDGKQMKKFEEIQTEADLLPPGAAPGTVPTDLEQATGLERLEILGKVQGVDIFDMKPLDSSRKGTLDNPILVRSFGEEQYAGCTGVPADSHVVKWLTMSRDRPIERCPECGNVLKMEYVGPTDDGHHHDHHHDDGHHYEGEPKTMADFVRPEYR
ncbi:putative cytochrome c subunit protein [Lasiodiplodia theobromae]|uniref:Cytochrome c oxidase subunit 4, mitochondrial n=1 Tax=Lasiodiplodia theobromae TaxID=45133 RepID=A0A5N5D0C4_9PEZI|nr:Cytochrome c oxidase polypeptide iv [Lasiodiplodia theobromae]KAB2570922.1 Cytochrome c oxidase subunit 4 [Lasiodiplodia theobromae]KAF4542075.1 Cytochrome c oxidase polypeptide iv [Lasiodiplodia theobromae]KAF9635490.1 putative cytochrome c subunit protein [Lasiodiplodia theobromae]